MCGTKLDDPPRPDHSEGMRLRLHRSFLRRNTAVSLRSTWALGTLVSVALGCVNLGCGSGGQTGDEQTGDNGNLQELRGKAQRLAVSGALPNAASSDTWDFGWKFYREEASPGANAFFSPYSISIASSMLVAAARGETKTEIDAALSFSNDTGPAFHQARNDVALALEGRNRPGTAETNAQTLRVSNDLWLDTDFRPESEYLDTLSAYYGVGVFLAPFATEPETARLAINDKVARDTEQLIQELLPKRAVDSATFVLTNALYFKAKWASEFSKTLTSEGPFLGTAGEKSVPLMRGVLHAQYFAGPDYQALSLPYFGGELELVALMPSAGSFESFSANLTAAQVTAAVSNLSSSYVDLRFPKFDIDSTVPLKERLQALGMQIAFTDGADLSGIGPGLYLSGAFHNAALRLDEEGTEAAAATAFVAVGTSAPPAPIPVTFDHPFVFFIRDVPSNSLLFVGHFANP